MPNAPFLAPERDGAFKRGRPRLVGSTIYYTIPGGHAYGVFSSALTNGHNVDYYAPWFQDTPVIVDQLAVEVTTLESASNMRFGIYAADADWQPVGTPLADSGDVSIATTGVKTYTPGTPLLLPRGRYLTVHNNNGTNDFLGLRYHRGYGASLPTTLGAVAVGEYTVGRTYAAFPTPGTAWTTIFSNGTTGAKHAVFLRVSSP